MYFHSLLIGLLLLSGSALSQGYEIPDRRFCPVSHDSARALIGRQLRIWDDGCIYETLNETDDFKVVPRQFRKHGGQSGWGTWRPQRGDTGTVVFLFPDSPGHQRYLLQIGRNYVPIDCDCLSALDRVPRLPLEEVMRIQDSLWDIRNANYAGSCLFKKRNVNGAWSRAGVFPLDSLSETYACSLKDAGVDTVLLAKYIFDNGALQSEKAYVLWLREGRGYAKAFYNNVLWEPTESAVTSFDVPRLLQPFFGGRLDTVRSVPRQEIQMTHNMGYSLQVQTPQLFFRRRFQNMEVSQDPTHPLAAWWLLLAAQMNALDDSLRKP